MEREQSLQKNLIGKFGFLDGQITIPRARRIFVKVPKSNFIGVLEYAKDKLGFSMLCTITGLDVGEELEFIYHLADESGIMLNLKLRVPKANPVIKTVTGYFKGAILYERELKDMFGAVVEGMQPGQRYPLPDEWPEGQYPLRKDWKAEMLGQDMGVQNNG